MKNGIGIGDGIALAAVAALAVESGIARVRRGAARVGIAPARPTDRIALAVTRRRAREAAARDTVARMIGEPDSWDRAIVAAAARARGAGACGACFQVTPTPNCVCDPDRA